MTTIQDETVIEYSYGYQEKTPYTGQCLECGQHIGMGVTVEVEWRNKRRVGIRCLSCAKGLKHENRN